MAQDLGDFQALALALAIGLLVGVERYKDRSPGERHSAGVRTFALFSLLGSICGLLGQWAFSLTTFAALSMLLIVGYYRDSATSLGVTTEVAALLIFWLGYLIHEQPALALSTAIVMVLLLASKRTIHDFVKEQISETELFDSLKFLVVVFVVYPLLPDRDLGPYEFLNPSKIWLLVVLVSTLSYFGYILIRVLGPGRGLRVSALLGGIVSTAAVTMTLAERARATPQYSRLLGVTAVMANSVQLPRLLLLIWILDRDLASVLAIPLLGMFAVGLLASLLLTWGIEQGNPIELQLRNPYSLLPALRFGLFFVGVFFLSKVATVWLGEKGVYVASAVAGLATASAVALSAAELVGAGALSVSAGSLAVLIGIAANALAKMFIGLVNGNRELASWLGGGFLAMLTAAFVLMWAIG